MRENTRTIANQNSDGTTGPRKLFTFVLDFRGGTHIQQVEATAEMDAAIIWAERIGSKKSSYLSLSDQEAMADQFSNPILTSVTGTTNVWCMTAEVNGALALVNVIETVADHDTTA